MQRKEGIALRAGRWSAKHRKTAVFGWLAFVVIALFAGQSIGMQAATQDDSGVGESGRADKIVSAGWKDTKDDATETILVQAKGPGVTIKDASFKTTVRDIERTVAKQPYVSKVKSPLDGETSVSADGRTALVRFDVSGDEENIGDHAKPVSDAILAQQKSHAGFTVEQFGGASAGTAIDDRVQADLKKAELLSLPVTLVILVFVFGAIVAAGIPVLLALTAVMAAIGLVALPSQLVPMDDSVSSVILLIGMAVGIDYSLFYIKREREERKRGLSEEAALEAAAATSGRAVLISGVTVLIAMAGMFLMGDNSFFGFAIATMLVVAIAMIGSVTVLPALLSKFGDKINKGRMPWVKRREKREAQGNAGPEGGRMWNAILDRVLKRPLVSAIAATAVLVALSVPALGLHLADSGTDGLPQDLAVVKTYNKIQKAFPGKELPATVVVKAKDVNSPQVQSAIKSLEKRTAASDSFGDGVEVAVNPDHTVAQIDVPVPGNGTDSRSEAAVRELRTDIVPATVGKVPGAEVGTTGYTAGSLDFASAQKDKAPLVLAFVLGLAFLLLLVTFRSIVIPIKAIVLNMLSVSAAYGVLVLVFQNGWGESLLGFHSTGTVVAWLPMFLFVILFGLSMDYHVFILSRIKEAYDGGASSDEAIASGIKSTAGTVTGAAVVMVAVFGIFATLSLVDMKMMGVGLAVAVLIDATIVRAVLLPATMKLLGDANWYLPRSLGWLPKVRTEGDVVPAAA
jgi:uncharacterized membrane protein YdfJ with MMPL/SSD domain